MTPHTITPPVEVVCRCKSKAGLRRSPASIPQQSSFLMRGTTSNGGIDGWVSREAHLMGAAIPNVLQPGAFVWFEKTQGPPVKVYLCWMAANEAVGCTHEFLTILQSSRRLVCHGRLVPGLRVNDISGIHWS
ncbi:uncharacterized protein TNCV_1581151 [Trichonephila clavipes]|nr:uncharacterized protein TNCV_1581151 [Trichonephila clavipes]